MSLQLLYCTFIDFNMYLFKSFSLISISFCCIFLWQVLSSNSNIDYIFIQKFLLVFFITNGLFVLDYSCSYFILFFYVVED